MIIDESAGEVVIGANTRICHGAVIQGPVVIGANCLIGNYAFIRPGTIISNGVKIGFATEIKNAVIEAEATIGPQCFIADSVVANQAYLGAQVRLLMKVPVRLLSARIPVFATVPLFRGR
nr:hypothetical protein [Escherichia coli]